MFKKLRYSEQYYNEILNQYENEFLFDKNLLIDDKKYEMKFQCKTCGNVFYRKIRDIYNNSIVCKNCNPVGSSGEVDLKNEIRELVKDKYNVLENQRFVDYKKYGLELDLYIEELNIGIEYDGLYFHSNEYYTDKKKCLSKKDYFSKYLLM